MNALKNLIDILHVKPDGENRYIGDAGPSAYRIYGGLTASQSLDAVRQTCPHDFVIQSLHGQFLRPGDPSVPIVINVEELKDGRRFKLYNVYCRQQGKIIFFATITFHLPEKSFEHMNEAPPLVLPDKNKAVFYTYRHEYSDDDNALENKPALEVRLDKKFERNTSMEPSNQCWFKTADDEAISEWQHTLLLTYISDWNMPGVAMMPHTASDDYDLNMASLDHSIWFYRQANIHDWIAYIQESPVAENSRGHTRGTIYNQAGDVLACVTQECFLSVHKKKLEN